MGFFLNSYWLDNDCYHIFSHRSNKAPPGVLPIMAYTGRFRPKRVPILVMLQVYERTGISLVEVYGRVKRWANRYTLWLRKSRENILVLRCIHNFKPVYLKGKGYLFCQKWYLTGLYYCVRNYCNLIGLEQWYFSLI